MAPTAEPRNTRRTVVKARLVDDALLWIKEQLPHGAWTPALKERDISKSTAHRYIQLRQKYPEMFQVGSFRSMQAALTDSKKSSAQLRRHISITRPIWCRLMSCGIGSGARCQP